MTAHTLAMGDTAVEMGACQKPAELAPLLDLLLTRPAPRTVVEIGTLAGGTLWAWTQISAPDALIVSIDLPGGDWGGGYTEDAIPRLLSYAADLQRIELIRGDSHHVDTHKRLHELLDEHDRDGIDLLFIDGDHTYPGVRGDYIDYSALVTAGGLIVFHDVLPHPAVPGCQVDRLWAELEGVYTERWEFLEPGDTARFGHQWGGIGAVERR